MHRCHRSALRVSSTLVPPNSGSAGASPAASVGGGGGGGAAFTAAALALMFTPAFCHGLGLFCTAPQAAASGAVLSLSAHYSQAQADHRGKKCLIGASEPSRTHSGFNHSSIASRKQRSPGSGRQQVHHRPRAAQRCTAAWLRPAGSAMALQEVDRKSLKKLQAVPRLLEVETCAEHPGELTSSDRTGTWSPQSQACYVGAPRKRSLKG